MKVRLDTKKIYIAMVEKGYNGTDLAKRIGVTQQAVSSVLNGKYVGRGKIVPGLCKELGLETKDIVIIED